MSTLLPIENAPALMQLTTAGVPFDGLAPASASDPLTPVQDVTGIWRYPAGAHAGLIQWNNNEPIICRQLQAGFGGSIAYSLYLVNLDEDGALIAGEKWLLRTATAATLSLDETNFKVVLLARQALQLITAAVVGQAQSVIAFATVNRA